MRGHNAPVCRLFVQAALGSGCEINLEKAQSHYLLHVLRLGEGDHILAFNGRDGEWRARIGQASKKGCALQALEQTRAQPALNDLWLCFAPLKSARLDYLAQKAVEMGAGRLIPVITQHTAVGRINMARLSANIIEAAEQCGVLAVPGADEPRTLGALLDSWPAERAVLFCDEEAEAADPIAALKSLPRGAAAALFIGPEGGFSREERARLIAMPRVLRLSLGPRILRADTAAVAALALIQATIGDTAPR